jgi:hypothetical protein
VRVELPAGIRGHGRAGLGCDPAQGVPALEALDYLLGSAEDTVTLLVGQLQPRNAPEPPKPLADSERRIHEKVLQSDGCGFRRTACVRGWWTQSCCSKRPTRGRTSKGLIVLPLESEETEGIVDVGAVVLQFLDHLVLDARRDVRVSWTLEDGPELEIVSVAGCKRDAIDVGRLVEPRGDSLRQAAGPGVLQCRSVKVSQPQAQRQTDEMRVKGRDTAGGGYRTVMPDSSADATDRSSSHSLGTSPGAMVGCRTSSRQASRLEPA